jgi:hypothetical protein
VAISIGELRGIISLQDNFSAPANQVAKGLGFMSESFSAVTKFSGLAVGAVTAAGGAIAALGIHGSKVASMETAFNTLSRSIGETGAAMLGVSRDATKGLISDMDLMAASNKAILLGLPVTSESMGTMARAATVLGRAMGQDAKKSLDDLTTALGRGSPLILDNLGLTVKVSEANEAYARTLGKSAGQLTEAEKKTAFYNAAMEAARSKVSELGDVQLTFGDRVQQARVMVGNFVDSLGKAIATSPVVAAGMDAIMKSIQGAFGGDQQALIKTLMGFVNQFAIFLVDVGQVGVEVARFIMNAWSGLNVLFNNIMGEIAGALSFAAHKLQELADAAALLPSFMVPGLEQVLPALRDIVNGIDGAKQSFADQTEEAITNAAAQNAAFDSVQTGLTNMRGAMVAASTAQTEMATTAQTAAKAITDTGTAVALTAEQIKAMEEATRKGQEAMHDMAEEAAERFRMLQEELTLANMTGLERRLADIEIARQKEIAGLQFIAFLYPAMYEELVEMVNQKHEQMATSAVESFAQQAAAAVGAGASTRAEAEKNLAAAKKNYQELLNTGKATFAQLQAAHAAVTKGEMALDDLSAAAKMQKFEMIASSASTILRSLFGKSKTAAIAAALIDAAAAIVKVFAQFGFFGFVPAAAIAAQTAAQIAKIRSTDASFAEGTPGMTFEDFGRGTAAVLHGPEAVVTRAQGEGLADMVGNAIRVAMSEGGGGPNTLRLGPFQIGGAHVLDELIIQRTRTGWMQVAT